MKPVLFVTGHVPAYRVAGLAALHEREGIEVACFGGRSLHGGPPADLLPFPNRRAGPRKLFALATGGGVRAVVCPTGGRAALLAAWAGARAGRVPLLLWASLWAHPRSGAHALSYLPLRRLYASADAVVTYGPHVSAYVRARGARNVHEAPQAVDNDFWSSEDHGPTPAAWPAQARLRVVFVGREDPAKGLDVLAAAWRTSRAASDGAALAVAGGARSEQGLSLGPLAPEQLRSLYASSDVLVVPSVATPRFREPWGLVVNEAMNQGVAVIASDAVGAAAGGLVRDGETGLVVPAGRPGPLAGAIDRLAADEQLRRRLADAGRDAVGAYTHRAWAEGFSQALATVGAARERW